MSSLPHLVFILRYQMGSIEMSTRSLTATQTGIESANRALTGKMLTQEKLANDLPVVRATVSKFFTGKPVDRQIFVQICQVLNLDWEEVAGQKRLASPSEQGEDKPLDIDALVRLVREQCAEDVQKQCGTMRVLDMEQPIELNEIYTDVNILEKLTRNQRREIDELLEHCEGEDFYRWGLAGGVKQKRITGLEAVERHDKLMILGKPGAGKTTFLKFLAMSCIGGTLSADRVPVFVTLKDFTDAANTPKLLEFISQQFTNYGITGNIRVNTDFFDALFNRNANPIEVLLRKGRILVLLDGLDEVREKDDGRVIREIEEFAKQYHQCQIVLTCRIAAKQYIFEQFTEVEIADFDDEQIGTFAHNWFRNKQVKAEDLLEELKRNSRVRELATSPLLLTLLCLTFENSGNFPANRSELYKEGLDALLKKWDAKRGIRRDIVYKDLSVQKKEDMLSQIALTTFEKGDYFFKQKQLEHYIFDYIRNAPNARIAEEDLQLDSEVVLKAIEAQHGLFVERARGIYSFSHLTYQEYFAARQIVVSTSPSKLETALKKLVSRVTETRWREVILLSVGMAREADDLLLWMKAAIDNLLAGDEKLQSFLQWADEKARSVNSPHIITSICTYYFTPSSYRDTPLQPLDLDLDLFPSLARALLRDLDRALDHALALDFNLTRDRDRARALSFDRALTRCQRIGEERLCQHLQDLKIQFPDPRQDRPAFQTWWSKNGKKWLDEFRQVLIKHHNIGYDWQFTNEQKQKWQQYYEANKLLVECLNSDCYVSRETRQKIEEELLLCHWSDLTRPYSC